MRAMKRLLLLLPLLLSPSISAEEIEIPMPLFGPVQGGLLSPEQSQQLTKFLNDGLKEAIKEGEVELIRAYKETLEIHYYDPANPNPSEDRVGGMISKEKNQ